MNFSDVHIGIPETQAFQLAFYGDVWNHHNVNKYSGRGDIFGAGFKFIKQIVYGVIMRSLNTCEWVPEKVNDVILKGSEAARVWASFQNPGIDRAKRLK